MNEFSLIEYLKKTIPLTGRVRVGIGDDAAVLDVTKERKLVVSTDSIVENVDFRMKEMLPENVGRKALAINLSDMAAMGAIPTACVISIGKPRRVNATWLKRFYKGLLALAHRYNVSCIGGDFSKSQEFFSSITILGEVRPHQFVKRSGALQGDWIAVTGSLGGSIRKHHWDFMPRVREGLFLAGQILPTSMIDVSDGLLQDLAHILKASQVGAMLDLDKIPVSNDALLMSCGDHPKALARALGDGEDFELLFTVTPWQKRVLDQRWKKRFPRVPLTWIGRIEGKKPRVTWRVAGKLVAAPRLHRKGYSHF